MHHINRIQAILMELLARIMRHDYNNLTTLFKELEYLQATYYPVELGCYWDRIDEELSVNNGSMEMVKQEVLDMLYEVDEIITNEYMTI